ncbi:MAG: hypothetical protein HYR84_10415 [Planctomycetes bacterium]|nr:hypothetical protein [Planctomycetota bacterium]
MSGAVGNPLLPFGFRQSVKGLDGEDVGGDELGDRLTILVANLLGFVGVEFRQKPLERGR